MSADYTTSVSDKNFYQLIIVNVTKRGGDKNSSIRHSSLEHLNAGSSVKHKQISLMIRQHQITNTIVGNIK